MYILLLLVRDLFLYFISTRKICIFNITHVGMSCPNLLLLLVGAAFIKEQMLWLTVSL